MSYKIYSDEYFMNEALRQAIMARDSQEVPVGAVIVADRRIIARAHNQTETLQDVTAHAEMLALTAAANSLGAKYLNDCSLYVTLEPCIMCASATSWAQLGKIFYGAKDPKAGFSRIIQDIIHPKTKIISGILEDECTEILSDFFRERR